jgi:hypothetical protein
MIEQHYQIGLTGHGNDSTPTQVTIRPSDTNVMVSWNYGFLQEASEVNGPWTYVPGAVSPSTIAVTNSVKARFFRVTLPPSGSPGTP